MINRKAEQMDKIKCPNEIVSYGIVCEKFPVPRSRFDSYDAAVRFTKFNQPDNRPFYIVKCVERFEILEKVK